MAETANMARVRAFAAHWAKKDADAAIAFFDPDCIYHNLPEPPIYGTTAIKAYFANVFANVQAIDILIRSIAEDAAGAVLTERTDRFLIAGRKLDVPVMGIFEFRQGRIFHWREYYDPRPMQALAQR